MRLLETLLPIALWGREIRIEEEEKEPARNLIFEPSTTTGEQLSGTEEGSLALDDSEVDREYLVNEIKQSSLDRIKESVEENALVGTPPFYSRHLRGPRIQQWGPNHENKGPLTHHLPLNPPVDR